DSSKPRRTVRSEDLGSDINCRGLLFVIRTARFSGTNAGGQEIIHSGQIWRGRVIHNRLRGVGRRLSSPIMNNSGEPVRVASRRATLGQGSRMKSNPERVESNGSQRISYC